MKTVKFEAEAATAWGQPVNPPIKYSGEFQAYETRAEVEAANDLLKDEEIVSFRNSQRKAAARQSAMQAALEAAGYKKPTLETDASLRFRNMVKTLVAAGRSEAEATQVTESLLGPLPTE